MVLMEEKTKRYEILSHCISVELGLTCHYYSGTFDAWGQAILLPVYTTGRI